MTGLPPTISVVIPTRNRPTLLHRAVRTALGQGFRDLEVIVVIDGPDDGAILLELTAIDDPRLRVITLDDCVGGAEARNIGVREARGHWIAFLDDDDEFLPGKLEKQLRRAESSQTKYTFITSRFIFQSPKLTAVWPRRFPAADEPMSEYLFCRRSFTRGEGAFQTSTFFCQRELLLAEPFTKSLKRHQDWDWLLRVAARDDVGIEQIDEALSIYHWSADGDSVSSSTDWQLSLKWAQLNRARITHRAYSFFIATEVAPQAAKSPRRAGTCLKLLRECCFRGSPTPFALLLFAGYYLFPERSRIRFHSLLVRRKARLTGVR